ncbi:MAG TPA: hypothetical protein VK348_09085 [Planctomycetota bacterium]|nr:hypothetical protein [Planctomycetota bacterium]
MNAGQQGAGAVFAEIARRGIRCCLWRGSVRVDRALAGASDFDLLVDPEHATALAGVFLAADCRRARTVRSDPGLEDYFGLAGPTGPLLHFHVHYRLVAGEPGLNRFHLPWERQVLDSRTRLGDGPILTADPVIESALLLVRCCLQLRLRDRLFGAPGGRRLVAKVASDLRALLPHDRAAAALALLCDWLGGEVARRGLDPGAGFRLADLWRLRRIAVAALRAEAATSGAAAALRMWSREFRAGMRRLARRWQLPLLPSRGSACGGMLVALAGPPATTRGLADDFDRLFGAKFDVVRVRQLDGKMARALRARSRGMLVIGEATAATPSWPPGAAPDLIVRADPGAPGDSLLGELVRQVWRRF